MRGAINFQPALPRNHYPGTEMQANIYEVAVLLRIESLTLEAPIHLPNL